MGTQSEVSDHQAKRKVQTLRKENEISNSHNSAPQHGDFLLPPLAPLFKEKYQLK